MANQWPKKYLNYYTVFSKRLELTADLCRGAIDEIHNREYVRKSVMFLTMNAQEMQIELLSLEPLRLQDAQERTEKARADGKQTQRSLRSPYWVNDLIGAKANTGRPKVGLIEQLTDRILDIFSAKNWPALTKSSAAMEKALNIILNDTNDILKVIARAPRPILAPPVEDKLIDRIERFLKEIPERVYPPVQSSDLTPEARDRKKKFPAKKPKRAVKIGKSKAVSTKAGGEQ